MENASSNLINEFAAARVLGLSVHTLRKDRVTRRRWPFVKLGRTVRYNFGALQALVIAATQGGAK